MASILFDSPIPYEGIATSRRREQALGSELASNMMQTYFNAQARRAEEQRWADEEPLRNARLAHFSAQAANEKAEAEINALAAVNAARRREGWAELAALQEEWAGRAWDDEAQGEFYSFMSRRPEFTNAPEAIAVGKQFDDARTARDARERWMADYTTRLRAAELRAETHRAANTIPPGTVAQRIPTDEPGKFVEGYFTYGGRLLQPPTSSMEFGPNAVSRPLRREDGSVDPNFVLVGDPSQNRWFVKSIRNDDDFGDVFSGQPSQPAGAPAPYKFTPGTGEAPDGDGLEILFDENGNPIP